SGLRSRVRHGTGSASGGVLCPRVPRPPLQCQKSAPCSSFLTECHRRTVTRAVSPRLRSPRCEDRGADDETAWPDAVRECRARAVGELEEALACAAHKRAHGVL